VIVDADRPRFLGPALADAITGIYAAYGVLGALVQRGASGQGHLVEISMLEAIMHFAVEPFAAFFALGEVPQSSDRPRLAQAYILKSKDGKFLATHLSSLEKFWMNITAALEAESLRADPRFSERLRRIDNYEELNRELNRRFGERTLAEWQPRFQNCDVPFAPVNTVEEASHDPQVRHLGLVVPVAERSEGAESAVRPALSFDGKRSESIYAAPLLDEHGEGIRGSNGWPDRKYEL
jgi:crotonobetainyl-CoA:carnitine CoA-transferase CaiB-like acyl-CoA transferase